jgi:hypothetical protein
MTSDSIPFVLYTAGALLMAVVLIIAWSDAGKGSSPAAGKRGPAYQASRFKPRPRRRMRPLGHPNCAVERSGGPLPLRPPWPARPRYRIFR